MINNAFQGIQLFLLDHQILAPLIYLFMHMMFAVCLIPCSPMAVIAGVLWGKWLGLLISIFSASVSSYTTFGLSRLLLRDRVHRFMIKRYSKTNWFLEQTKKHGWKFVASIQLNPAAPGSSMGYLFGLTGISFSVYAFFLAIFMIPMQLILVTCGNAFPQILQGQISWIILIAFGILLGYFGFGLRHEQKK